MSNVSEIIGEIRNLFMNKRFTDEPFNSDLDKWNSCCVSMDMLEDTALAIECYESKHDRDSDGEKYLKLYGFLQAIFLQQDSVKSLHEIFVGPIGDYPQNWKELRNLRNLTVGHPLERKFQGSTSRCYISRITIDKQGFEYLLWDSNSKKDMRAKANLTSILLEYQKEIVVILAKIHNALNREVLK